MKSDKSDIKRIHQLIDRYFDATATDAEERELRLTLATTPLSSEKIDEARAVMGYFAATRNVAAKKPAIGASWLRVAAAIAVAVVCGTALLTYQPGDKVADRCVAYIGETEITDSHVVLAMMRSELSEIGEASQSVQTEVASQLSTLFNSSLQ